MILLTLETLRESQGDISFLVQAAPGLITHTPALPALSDGRHCERG
jgi:hypothetical protein